MNEMHRIIDTNFFVKRFQEFRTLLHRIYRLFKFITISISIGLLAAQVLSVIFLPFDEVELVLKIFLSSFSVLIILNEAEWWGMLRGSPLFSHWIPRGVSGELFEITHMMCRNCNLIVINLVRALS